MDHECKQHPWFAKINIKTFSNDIKKVFHRRLKQLQNNLDEYPFTKHLVLLQIDCMTNFKTSMLATFLVSSHLNMPKVSIVNQSCSSFSSSSMHMHVRNTPHHNLIAKEFLKNPKDNT
jgi:hypothetical protein